MEYKTGESAPLGGALSRETPRIGLVLLAAGQSRRMGTNKQLLQIGRASCRERV